MTETTVREALAVLVARAIPGRWTSVQEVRRLTKRNVSRNAVSKVARKMDLEARYGRLGGYRRKRDQQVPDGTPVRRTHA